MLSKTQAIMLEIGYGSKKITFVIELLFLNK
jgi:hypothetical protein